MQTNFSPRQILGFIGALAGLISFFALPWFAVRYESATGLELAQHLGALWTIPLGAVIIIALFYFSTQVKPATRGFVTLICGAGPLLIYIFSAQTIMQRAVDISRATGSIFSFSGSGFYIATAGFLLAIIVALTEKPKLPSEQSSAK